ncbi:MAG TPA: hypothetical protein DCZ97_15940 [Syntrophus sp. (in: bacteria)]|nr:hypothetical protein [Syntrophus sp. (in: bacteria)]
MPIYKYVTIDRLDILTNGLIRFTQPSAFNDPFEAYPFFSKLADDEEINKALQIPRSWDSNKIDQLIDDSLQKALNKQPVAKVLPYSMLKSFMQLQMKAALPLLEDLYKKSITMDGAPYRHFMTKTILSAIDKELGILCLTERCDNLLMWAHYTADHTGFVIEFDEKHPFWDQRKNPKEIIGILRKVRYSKERPEVTLFDMNKVKQDEQGLMQWAEDLCWTKSDHWQYEDEWRMVYTLRDCQNKKAGEKDICLFPIPTECITSVIVGCRMSDADKQRIRDLIKSDRRFSHIKVLQADIDNREYKLNFS